MKMARQLSTPTGSNEMQRTAKTINPIKAPELAFPPLVPAPLAFGDHF